MTELLYVCACIQQAQLAGGDQGYGRNQEIQGNILQLLPEAATELFQMAKTSPDADGWKRKDFMIEFFPTCQCISGRQLTRRAAGLECSCRQGTRLKENQCKEELKLLLRTSHHQWWLFSQVRLLRPNKKQLSVDCVVMRHVHGKPCGLCCFAVEIDGSIHNHGTVMQLEQQRSLRAEKEGLLSALGVNLIVWKDMFDASSGNVDVRTLECNKQLVSTCMDQVSNVTE